MSHSEKLTEHAADKQSYSQHAVDLAKASRVPSIAEALRERCDEIWRIGKAELAAERDCSIRFEAQVDDCQQKLAAEREKRQSIESINKSLAQALDAERERADKNADVIEATALELGDARQDNQQLREQLALLVDALKKCKSQLDMEPQLLPLVERLQRYIKDALAGVKEGKV